MLLFYLLFYLFLIFYLFFIYFFYKRAEILSFSNHELANYMAKFEIITKRNKSLEMMKDGFNTADCLQVINSIIKQINKYYYILIYFKF